MRTPQQQQTQKIESSMRKNSKGKVVISSKKMNEDLKEIASERYTQNRISDMNAQQNEMNNAMDILHGNKNNVLEVDKEDTYQERLRGDSADIEKLMTERADEEVFVRGQLSEEQKKSFRDAINSLNEEIKEADNKDAKERKIEHVQQQMNDIQTGETYLYYVYGGNYPETVWNALKARGNWQEAKESDNIEKCHFLWRPVNYQPEVYKRIDKRIVRSSYPFIFNHFEILKGLCTKSGLIRSLKQYYFNNDQARQAGYSIFDTTPTTFLMASGVEDAEHTEMVSRYRDFQRGYAPKERIPIKHCVNNIWLVKPSNANQGRGIEIFSDIEELLQFVGSRPQFTCCVVQKYLERPLLFKGRKFDFRIWALFTHRNEVFMYKNGYLRTSSDDYNLTNGNNYVHLTNNCLQKYGSNYGVHEDGNTVGFDVLQQFLDENYPQYNLNVREHFVPRMKDLIIDSFLATKNQLNPNRRKNCFELLGYDFIVDEDFRIWMIEINTNPYFGVPNSFIEKLLPKMMDDLLDIVVDPIYPPAVRPETLNAPNDFELLYCEGNSPYSANPVNIRRPFTVSPYPVPELAQQVGPKAPRVTKLFPQSLLKQKEEVKEDGVQSESTTPLMKANQRSKSMAANKTVNYQQYLQNQLPQSTPNNDKNRNVRSKSIYKSQNNNNQNVTLNSKENTNAFQSSASSIKPKLGSTNPQNTSSQQINKKALYLQPTATSQNRQQSIHQSKTPKQQIVSQSSYSSKKNSINNISQQNLLRIGGLDKNATERGTPRADTGPFSGRKTQQKKNASRYINNGNSQGRDASRSDQLLYGNIAKEVPKIEITNSINGQNDKLLRNFSEKGIQDKKELSQDQIEKIFKSVIDKINLERKDSQKTQKNIEILQQIFENSKISSQNLEIFVNESIQLIVSDGQIDQASQQIVNLLAKLSEKLQFKQYLSRNRNIDCLVNTYTQVNDQQVKQKILAILINLSCLLQAKSQYSNDPKQANQSPKPQIKQEIEGVQALKDMLFSKCLDYNIVSLIVSESQQNSELISQLESRFEAKDIQILINQLNNEKQIQIPLSRVSFNPLDTQSLAEGLVGVRQNTDSDRYYSLGNANDDPSPSDQQPNDSYALDSVQFSPRKETDISQIGQINEGNEISMIARKEALDSGRTQQQRASISSKTTKKLPSQTEIIKNITEYLKSKDNSAIIQRLEKVLKEMKTQQQLFSQETQQPRRNTTKDKGFKIEDDSSPSDKLQVYESPFRKSIKNSQNSVKQTDNNIYIKSSKFYQTPDNGVPPSEQVKQSSPPKYLRKSGNNLNSFLQQNQSSQQQLRIEGQNNIQQNQSMSAAQLNTSSYSLKRQKTQQSQLVEEQIYTKTAERKTPLNSNNSSSFTTLKYAPVLNKNKQNFIIPTMQNQDTQKSEAKLSRKDQQTTLINAQKQLTKDKRLIQSAKLIKNNNTAQSSSFKVTNDPITSASGAQTNLMIIQNKQKTEAKLINKLSRAEQESLAIQSNEEALDKINKKINDIQNNLHILSQYSGSKQQNIYQKGISDSANLNSYESNESGNYQPRIINDTKSNMKNLQGSGVKNQVIQYNSLTRHEDQMVEENNETPINKDIMPFEFNRKVNTDTNVQYFKRGVQARQSAKKPIPKSNQLLQDVQDQPFQLNARDMPLQSDIDTTTANNKRSSVIDLSHQKRNTQAIYSPFAKTSKTNAEQTQHQERRREASRGKQ